MADIITADDKDLKASMDDFEAAVTAKHQELEPPPLRRILVALDGSNQDAMAIGLAAALARTTSAALHLLYAYEGEPQPERDAHLEREVAALSEAGLATSATRRCEAGTPSYLQIAGRARELDVDLLVVPAPYLEDIAELGRESIGVNLDKLMAQERPLLVVREPRENPAESLKPLLLPLSVHVEENPLAAAWALRIIGAGGTLRMLSVVEENVVEAAAELLGEHAAGDLDLEHLAGLHRPRTAGLIAALHRHAQQRGLGSRVSVREGDLVQRVLELAEAQHMLIVTGCDTDPASASYRSVQAILRAARDPVLVV